MNLASLLLYNSVASHTCTSGNTFQQSKHNFLIKAIFLLCVLCATVCTLFSQEQTFDLITYTPPKGWTKDEKKNVIVYSTVDNKTKTWCQIGIFRSTASKGTIDADLESEWNELAAKQYNITDSMQATETQEAEGWKIKAGSGKFTFSNQPAAALLTTFSGYNRCVSIMAITNSQGYLETVENFIGTIDLKKPEVNTTATNNQVSQQPVNNTTGSSGGFRYTTSNFDDGWTATEEADWVRVTKGNITMLLHYAKEGTTVAADPEPHVNNAWNILVATRYSNLKNYKVASPSLDPQRAYLGAGELTDKKTGKQVYVALFRKGSSNWIEFITPDKNTFVKEFGADINNIGWDASSDIWKPLLKMFNYNKFAVAASDLTGKWASWSGSNVQYVNVYTGLDAGMGHAQSGNEIAFNADGTYNREYKGVSGSPGGGNQYYGEKNNGNAIVSNWEVQLTNSFKGATHVFTAQFEAVKGGRILHLWRSNIEEMYLYKIN